MIVMRTWLVGVAIVGLLASAAAAGLLWMVFTRPVRLAELLGAAF